VGNALPLQVGKAWMVWGEYTIAELVGGHFRMFLSSHTKETTHVDKHLVLKLQGITFMKF
jgi:hypothetical protein